ncbi:CDF family Co(II)/Ni(II) efflux transporter DmeF [Colwellia ponticola]|uniref:CDF family Co(II)/Ni(II) efflux transporter DmeF n=1 Tax=Colwellia ponticola TaxID=2304625 RepID=A0A8H2JMQ5_9GAMM|nr:CDF family Co(II)/Ni(II) efflux transporter DmeF [Colwellia ponticola]TMM46927.1 CDF family Co(II)/Ni(II) efflux transporter DmeF [Colwellia ponticola]
MYNENNIQWDHSHDFAIDNQGNKSKVKIVFWLTTVIMILEITAGTWSGSMALLADGWHMGTHSAAFLITIFAYSYAKKNANNKDFSFGTGKVNYLGGFASAIALAIIALMMALESVHRLMVPQAIYFNEAIAVAIIGLVVNIVSVFVLHDDHHHHHHHEGHEHHHDEHHHDHNLKAAYFHVLADTLTSLLAIVALLAGKYFGWIWMDALMGIVGAVVILRWSYGLLKESSRVLLDKSVDTASLTKAINAISVENETIIRDIHLWQVASGHQVMILSIAAKKPLEPSYYKQLVQQHLPNLSHITIEVIPV